MAESDRMDSIERETGIAYDRLKAWFDSQPTGACRVTLTCGAPRTFGHTIGLPRTLLRIEGPTEDVAELYRRFELQFMSAGG